MALAMHKAAIIMAITAAVPTAISRMFLLP
jgi:hypothetical protein